MLALKAEYREEAISDNPDDQFLRGDVFGTEATQANGQRDSTAFAAEFAIPLLDNLEVQLAVRYEDYSDFGDTLNGKLAAAFDLTDSLKLRGAVSNGFRAPSLQQQFFNNTSTQFNGGVAEQVGTFRNDSQIAMDIGIPELKEETSMNYSLGFVWQPADNWSFTVDGYFIEIEDRIVISGEIEAGLDPALVAVNRL